MNEMYGNYLFPASISWKEHYLSLSYYHCIQSGRLAASVNCLKREALCYLKSEMSHTLIVNSLLRYQCLDGKLQVWKAMHFVVCG